MLESIDNYSDVATLSGEGYKFNNKFDDNLLYHNVVEQGLEEIKRKYNISYLTKKQEPFGINLDIYSRRKIDGIFNNNPYDILVYSCLDKSMAKKEGYVRINETGDDNSLTKFHPRHMNYSFFIIYAILLSNITKMSKENNDIYVREINSANENISRHSQNTLNTQNNFVSYFGNFGNGFAQMPTTIVSAILLADLMYWLKIMIKANIDNKEFEGIIAPSLKSFIDAEYFTMDRFSSIFQPKECLCIYKDIKLLQPDKNAMEELEMLVVSISNYLLSSIYNLIPDTMDIVNKLNMYLLDIKTILNSCYLNYNTYINITRNLYKDKKDEVKLIASKDTISRNSNNPSDYL